MERVIVAERLEWRGVIEKKTWGKGPWMDEPDKVQFVDEATGLDCLMVRNHNGGNWCGYVGVAEGHPWFDVAYCGCPKGCGEPYCSHSPESSIRVHGGLTYSYFCTDATRETWERWRTNMLDRRTEAAAYPRGDSAQAWKEDGHLVDDYEGWCQLNEARAICHIPLEGRPARVWWFGFDCAHSGDVSPGFAEYSGLFRDGAYRDRAYVEGEVRDLAQQLAALPE
jgi:hypothetical protein